MSNGLVRRTVRSADGWPLTIFFLMIADPISVARESPARSAEPAYSRRKAALVLLARGLRHERFLPAAQAVLTDLCATLGCERSSLGLHLHGRLQVVATSSGVDPTDRRNPVDGIAAAMQEAVDQRTSIIYPLPSFNAATLTAAHAELARATGGLSILSVPIIDAERCVGVLLFERVGGFTDNALKIAQDAALFVGPVLDMKHRLESPVGGRLVEALAPRGVRLGDRTLSPWRYGLAALALLSLLVALWPVTLRVVAPARVEGIDQRILAAPVDGFIAQVAARPGEPVRQGQVIASLEDRDLLLRRDRLAAQIAQHDKQYREALAGDDAGDIVQARAVLDQSRTEHTLVESEIERTRLRSPFDGTLVDGDLSAQIGAPVTRGQTLLTVSPVQGYKVVAEVDDQDVTLLQVGQAAQVLFAGLGQAPVAFDVQRISPVAAALDQRNVFEVEGRVGAMQEAALRPGLRGIARIDIDRRLQVQVWWLRLGNWLRRTIWQVIA